MYSNLPRHLTVAKVAWAAGFIDGEACIRTYKVNGKKYLQVRISQIDTTPLFLLKELFGGIVFKRKIRPPYRQVSEYSISGKPMYQMLKFIEFHCTVKKADVIAAIKFMEEKYGDNLNAPGKYLRARRLSTYN